MNSRTIYLAIAAASVCLPSAAMAMASAEFYTTKAYQYGRFEARVRFAPGDGVISSFFLWKEGSEAANAFWNELDFEKYGANCALQTNAFYGNPEKVHEQKHSLSVDLCGEYHDYRYEWTPTYIAWVLDGKEIRRDTGETAKAYADNATAGMTMHFNVWPGNGEFGGDISKTTLPVRQYISWVQYSSYNNGSFKVEWREDFQAAAIPDGWAVGNWSSAYNKSTHNTQNVAVVNGIAVLSLTADNATGNPGTPPVDPAAGTTSGTGGTPATGGTTSATGGASGGGKAATGGTTATGGAKGTGGVASSGGTSTTGGAPSASGGAVGSGGSTTATTGGAVVTGGTTTSSGTGGSGNSPTATGGTGHTGGVPNTGGTTTTASGGASGTGGATVTGGTTPTGEGTGGTAGPTSSNGGCSCRTSPIASPFGPTVLLFALVAWVSRRKKKS